MQRNAERLRHMVDRLLELSRLYAGQVDPHVEPVDLTALTAGLAGMFRSAVEHAGLALDLDCHDLGEPAFVDRGMWEQVVLTLLAHAVAVSSAGRITVALGREGDSAVLRIANPDAAEVQPDDGGIGPALVAELVGLLRGSVSTDRTASGLAVAVTVPLGRAHVPSGTPDAAPPGDHDELREESVAEALWWLRDSDAGDPQPVAPTVDPDAGRILVVDDHADMRAYLVRLLGRTHRVDTAADGTAALAAAVADPPELVLADVSLPGLSGLELLTALRGDPRTSLVPVVLMSGRAGPEAAVEGLGAGADDYLVTPFSARELRARVDGRVALGRARREAERRFRAMADSTPALIWADGPGGRRLFVNRGWSEFTGAEPDADLGLAWQDRIHPADRAHYARVRAAADGGPFEVEYRLRAADGHHRWVLDRGAPAEGYVGGYVGGCLDIDSRVGERERQRLLAVVGAALDRETTLTGRRQMLVRTLVDEGLADMARFVEIDDGRATDGRAIAAHTPEQEAALHRLDVSWMQATAMDVGEVRRYTVDEAFIQASSTDERQRELRRSMDFAHDRARPARRARADLGAARRRPDPRLRPVRRRRHRAARRSRRARGDRAGQRAAAGAGAGQPGPAGGPAAGDRRAVGRRDPRAGRRGRRRAVRRAGPGDRGGAVAAVRHAATTRCSSRPTPRPPSPSHGAHTDHRPGRARRGRPHAQPGVGGARQPTPSTASRWSRRARASAWSGSAGIPATCGRARHARR